MSMYYPRAVEPLLKSAVKQFPAILLTGVRQSGKSTLLRHLFPAYTYVTLDDGGLCNLARNDPALFLNSYESPLIIDEIQYAPELFSALKIKIDLDRNHRGRYLLTGSQAFQMMQGVSETLAGRVAVLRLHPLAWGEFQKVHPDSTQVIDQMVRGFYPELMVYKELDSELWSSSYFSTYIERDVRNIKQITDLGVFRDFLTLLAARVGRLLNFSEIAKECGISQPTVRSWIRVLETSQLIYLLRPFHRNITKRIVKASKLYFMDTGLLCYLLGIDTGERLRKAAERGHLFENMVVAEAIKRASTLKGKTDFWFYRTQSGVEVDLVVERKGRTYAYEIKFTETPRPKMTSALKLFGKDVACDERSVLCLKKETVLLTESISSVHWFTGLKWE